jgi:hypothetical protein
MQQLSEEWSRVQQNNYQLSFSVPTPPELEKLRRIHRDRTEDEIQRVEDSRKSLEDFAEMIEREEIILEDLPKSLRERLTKLLGGK